MEVGKRIDLTPPELPRDMPMPRFDSGPVHLSMDENGAVAQMCMDPKPFDPMRVGDVNRNVTARFDDNGQLQVTTTLSGGCFPHAAHGASTQDLVALRKAILEKISAMDPSSAETAAFQKLANALLEQISRQVGTDDFHGIERPHHPLPPNVLDWNK